MDYKKKYDEALERAKQKIEAGFLAEDDLSYIFPELRESEDERIRKEIVDYFKKECEYLLNDFRDKEDEKQLSFYNKAIAYLEKQKDASKAIEAVDRIDKYIDEHLANAHDMKDSNPDKKYYRGWDDALGKMAGILQDVYSDEKQKEQKPTDRFEEAREKYQVEWSEEDENALKYLHKLIEFGYSKNFVGVQTAADMKRWVNKSLRPSWKPSEEQIHAIIEALKYLPNNKDEWRILDTLADVFRKLM